MTDTFDGSAPGALEALARRVPHGDRRAVEDLFRYYWKRLLAFFHKFNIEPKDVEDLAQQTITKFIRELARGRFKPGKARLSTWLYRIAYNEARSYFRKKSRDFLVLRDIQDADEWNAARDAPPVCRGEIAAAVEEAFSCLSELEIDVIRLRFWGQFTLADVALLLNVTEGSVKWLLKKAMSKLKPRLEADPRISTHVWPHAGAGR